MTGVAPLLVQLREAAAAEAAERLEAAQAEAGATLEAARARAAAARERAVAGRREALEAEGSRRHDAARSEGERETLAARQRFLGRVFDEARRIAPARLAAPDAAAWLAATIRQALAFLPEGPVVVYSDDPRAGDAAGEAAPGRDVRVAPARGATGLIIEGADGRVRVEATLDRFLRAERARLAQALVGRVGSAP